MADGVITEQIEVEAQGAVSNLDKVDSALERIEKAITGIAEKLDKIKGIDSLTSAVNKVSSSLDKINSKNIDKVSDSLREVAEQANNVSKTVAKPMDETARAASEAEKAIQSYGKSLAKDLRMDKAGTAETINTIRELYNALKEFQTTGDRNAWVNVTEKLSDVESTLKEFGKVKPVIDETTKAVLDWVQATNRMKDTKIILGDISKNFTDTFNSMRSTLGKNFVTKGNGRGIDAYLKELNDTLHTNFEESPIEGFEQLVNVIREAKSGYMSLNDAMKQHRLIDFDIKGTLEGLNSELLKMATQEVEAAKSLTENIVPAANETKKELLSLSDALNNTSQKNIDIGTESLKQLPAVIQNATAPLAALYNQIEQIGDGVPRIEGVSQALIEMKNTASDVEKAFTPLQTDRFLLPMRNAETLFLPMKEAAESTADDIVKVFDDATSKVNESFERSIKTDSWKEVIKDIERMQAEFESLSKDIGEANAEMSIAQNIHNRITKAFSDTSSGKMMFDIDNMKNAQAMLNLVDDKLQKFHADLKDPFKIDIDVTEPTNNIEKLYARLKELQSLLSDMRNNKINFTDDEFLGALREYESVQKQIKDIESPGTEKANKGGLEFMATIIAIQHELDKVSGMMSHFGDVALNAFKKCLTPLKLFEHEFDHIKTLVLRIGSAFAMMSKPITKVFDNIRKKWSQTMDEMHKKLHKFMRTFAYMGFRKLFTHIYKTMGEAVESLAKFSHDIGTQFNVSMSHITADFRYIGASLVAAFSPLLNVIVPILDRFTDALVEAINAVNMFFTALTGAKSFTIAKKKIIDYADALKKANKAAKQLTMGIDELNILNDKSSSSDSELDDLFDWEEIDSSAIPKAIRDAADKVKEMAKQLWSPIQKAWDNVGDYVIDGFKHMVNSIRGLLGDIARDFLKVWQQPETVAMLEDILGIFGDIFNIIGNIADGLREAWNYNETGLHILEDIRDIFAVIFKHIHNITSAMVDWSDNLDFKPLLTAFEAFLRQFKYAIDQIGVVFEDIILTVILPLLKKVLEDYAPRVIGIIGDITEGIGNIAKQLHKAWDALDFGDKVVAGIDGIVQAILPHLEAVGESFIEWADNLDFKPLMKAFTRLLNSLKPVADFIGGVFEDIVNHYILPMIKHITEKVLPMMMDALSHFFGAVDWTTLRKNIDKVIEAFEHLQGAIGEGVADAMDRIGQAIAKFVNGKEFQEFLNNLADFMNRISPELISNVLTAIGIAILRIAEALVKFVNSDAFQHFLNTLINFLTYTDANKLANYLLDIAKAIAFFKFGAFVAKGFSNFLSFIALIGKIKEAKALKQIAESVGEVSTKASGLGEIFKTIGTAVGGVIKILGGVAAVIGGAVLAIKEFVDMWVNGWDVIKTILEALGLAIAAVGAVILGAPAAVAGVVAGIVFAVSQLAILLHEHWDAISSWFSETWANFSQWCSTTWQGIVKGIVSAWDGFSSSMQAVWNTISEWFSSVWNAFKTWAVEIWGEIVQGVLSAWNGFLENIQALWETVSAWFSEVWTTFKEWVATTWLNIVQGVYDAWNGFVEKITGIWDAARVWFESAWGAFHTWADTTWKNITQSIADSWNNLKEKASKKWEEIREVIATKWEEIKTNTLNKWEEIKSTLDQKWSAFKRDAETLWNNLKNTLAAVWDSIQGRWSNTWNEIKNAVAIKWNEIVSIAHSIFEGIGDFFKKLWDGIEDTWNSVWGAIQGTVSKWWNTIREDAQKGWDKAVSFVDGLWNGINKTWGNVWASIQTTLSGAWQNIKSTALSIWNGLSETLGGIWSKIKEGAKGLWDGVSAQWKAAWEGIGTFIKGVINNVLGGIEKLINGAISGVNWLIEKINAVSPDFIGDLPSVPEVHLPRFATGGFPEDGLFLANHNELVGKFSNGQTAVANNQQITDGIREAVASAMIPVLNEIAQNTRETADKDLTLNVDSREIARANNTGQSKLGRTLLTTT